MEQLPRPPALNVPLFALLAQDGMCFSAVKGANLRLQVGHCTRSSSSVGSNSPCVTPSAPAKPLFPPRAALNARLKATDSFFHLGCVWCFGFTGLSLWAAALVAPFGSNMLPFLLASKPGQELPAALGFPTRRAATLSNLGLDFLSAAYRHIGAWRASASGANHRLHVSHLCSATWGANSSGAVLTAPI